MTNEPDGRWPIVPSGICREARSDPSQTTSPGLFLDRDSVVVDIGFLATPDDVHLLPGEVELIADTHAIQAHHNENGRIVAAGTIQNYLLYVARCNFHFGYGILKP